jgi:hypothetical protein
MSKNNSTNLMFKLDNNSIRKGVVKIEDYKFVNKKNEFVPQVIDVEYDSVCGDEQTEMVTCKKTR